MKKELVISARFDTSDFDKSVETMQKKLKEIYAPADAVRAQTQTSQRLQQAGYGGIMSGPSQEAANRATQSSRRELDQLIREQAKGQEQLGKLLVQRNEALEKLKKQQQEVLVGSQKELDIKKQIAAVEENNARMREAYRGKDQALNNLLDVKARSPFMSSGQLQQFMGGGGSGVYGGGHGGPGGGPGVGGGGGAGGGFNAASVLNTVGAIAGIVSAVYKQVYESPLKTSMATGSAMQGTFGREYQARYSGNTVYESAFMPEKMRAAQMAGDLNSAQGRNDRIRLAGGTALGMGAIAQGGLTPSALLTGVGAGAMLLSNDRMRALTTSAGMNSIGDTAGAFGNIGVPGMSKLGNYMHKLGEEQMDQYNAKMAESFAENFSKALGAQKDNNPLKTLAAEEYQQNYQRNLNFQRSTGLTNAGFHGAGGFREQAINSGFTDSMSMDMAGGILGAGGSTRMARNSAFGLQVQRSHDLTNVGNVLGTLSGGMGSSQSSQQALIKILAEGTRTGLDNSEFREENRKFTQTAAELVIRSGASSSDADTITSRFSSFLSDKSTQGIGAAKGAYEMYQDLSSTGSGPQGVMRAAGFLSDPIFSKMQPLDRMALSSLPADQMTSDNEVIQDLAKRYNTTPEEIIKNKNKIDNNSIHRSSRASDLSSKISGIRKQQGITGKSSDFIGPLAPGVREDFDDANRELKTKTIAEYPQYARDPRGLDSFLQGTTSGDPSKLSKALEDAVKGKTAAGADATGRIEDQSVAAEAESSRIVLDNFRKMKDDLVPAAEAIGKFNKQLEATVEIIMKMPEEKRAPLIEKLFPGMFGGASTQTQGGKATK